ncbi:DUF6236 family protein [Clostridium intestinale]|uniref:Uncharacterized protein n=1 Tax=Clostridium intestinale URNW TaxID=1294142 RepID=U2NSW7_9CLOT|nr:DUF6236 family protein [Clostridium intestinale]ERK31956.1 hypothetical protein CINTURNW_1045 [Clostridium intestinale URNW]
MRGIIISPEYEIKGTSLKIKTTEINPINLRQYLLYWDKIDFPNNNIISIGSSPEIRYLEEVGVLKRTFCNMNINGTINFEDVYLDMQMNVFKQNNNLSDEIWSIAQPIKNIVLPKENRIETRNIQVELYDSIPVPSKEVSLEDILNFKERRHDELREFRIIMDEMYLSIINSPDIDLSKNMHISKLQNKIIDLNKLMNEAKMRRFLSSVKVELDISGILNSGVNALAGYTLGSTIGFPTLGAVLGLAGSFVKVSHESSLKPKEIPDGMKDYAYLYYQNREIN